MDHNAAVQLQAAVKYVLGELSQSQREEYEEHYFDCGECAVDLKAAAAFADTSREVFRHEADRYVGKEAAPARARWFGWLRPAFAVPVFATLLLVIVYQNSVTIPKAKEEAARGSAQLFASSVSLQMANVRGGDEIKVQVPKNESFALKFDFTPSRRFDSYIGRLEDASGRSLLQVSIPGSLINREAELVVPAGLLQPGKYSLVSIGNPGPSGQAGNDEVLRLGFSVEFLP
jgi:anti-sigma factor RsiW